MAAAGERRRLEQACLLRKRSRSRGLEIHGIFWLVAVWTEPAVPGKEAKVTVELRILGS